MTNKVVYNACYGGFSLSLKAAERLLELGIEDMQEQIEMAKCSNSYILKRDFRLPIDFSRHDPRLVQVVEELGEKANGAFAQLEIVELDGNKYIINEYDGFESIEEPDDIDWIVVKD